MAKEVAINTENLKSYIKASNIPMEIIRKDVPKIEDILEGKKSSKVVYLARQEKP